jgi:multidrug efflux system membrane fusion protein
VKRAILLIIIGVAIGGGAVWLTMHTGSGANAKPDSDDVAKKPAGKEEDKVSITHDTNDNIVISMNREQQDDVGIALTNPPAAQVAREVKAYGRVVDPAPIADLWLQLSTAEAAFDNSHQELERMKTLKEQNNASEKALQTASAAYLQNLLSVNSIRAKLELTWGTKLAELTGDVVIPPGTQRKPPPGPNPIMDPGNVLIRLNLPAGEALDSQPESARIVSLAANATPITAVYFDELPSVDPQTQSRGFLFYATTNSLKAGEAVTGYLQTGAEPLKGVIIPRSAVVRTEGKGWIYVLNENGKSFTRKEIPLDHQTDNGWFVATGITGGDHAVVTGAQVLLSEELKASMSAD